MTGFEGPALRAAVRGTLPPSSLGAKGVYVARAAQLEAISQALMRAGLDALLVKGASLAITVYPAPWDRPMSDVDLVARPGAHARVVAALEGLGYRPYAPHHRPLTHALLGEQQMMRPEGVVAGHLVEVHHVLDRIATRAIDYDDVFARGRAPEDLPGLVVPGLEDHALLVALHAAQHDFTHDVAFVDLARLLDAGAQRDVLVSRARGWGLSTVMFVALSTLRALGSPRVDDAWLDAFRPPRVRLALVGRIYRVGQYPVASRELPVGVAWVTRQAVLRDDLGRFARGVARYGWLRLREETGIL